MARYRKREAREWARQHLRGVANVIIPSYSRDLKRLNDALGHAAGDAAIRLVARALRAQFRIADPVFRIGGDEFLVILEGGRSADLAGRMDSLDTALRQQRLPGLSEPVDLVVAWGMADFDGPQGFPEALARADAAMYECKARRKGSSVRAGSVSDGA